MTIKYRITVEGKGEAFDCSERQTLLQSIVARSTSTIPYACQQGGCGVCVIEVVAGSYTSKVMSRAYISEADERRGRVLACRIRPTSDVKIRLSTTTKPIS